VNNIGKINTSDWGEFKLGKLTNHKTKEMTGTGLFNIISSVPYNNKDIEEVDENGLNYVTRSKFNNGIKCKVAKKDEYNINPAGTISFGAENADFFYQTEPYITGNNMHYIDTRHLSERTCLYIKTILQSTFTADYSFSDGMIPRRIYNKNIKLPVDADGNPDWQYMEDYMCSIETKVKDILPALCSAIQYQDK